MGSIAPSKVSQFVVGHRGNSGNPLNSRFVENTIPSFESAFSLGADGIELDVHLTPDGHLVVVHDDTFIPNRPFFTNGLNETKLISEYTLQELKSLRLQGELATGDRTDLQIPTLDEVHIPPGKKLFLELKFLEDVEPSDKTYLKRLVKEVVGFIERNDLFDQVYVLSFVGTALDEVKKLNPRITTAYNVYQHETDQANSLDTIRALRSQYGFDIINPPFEQVTDGSIDTIHSEGLGTFPWIWRQTFREEEPETERLLRSGVDGTINNSPCEALGIRNRLFPVIY